VLLVNSGLPASDLLHSCLLYAPPIQCGFPRELKKVQNWDNEQEREALRESNEMNATKFPSTELRPLPLTSRNGSATFVSGRANQAKRPPRTIPSEAKQRD